MVYRKRWRKVRSATDEELRTFIANHISNSSSKADREEAITYMIRMVREGGLHFPTRQYIAEPLFERLGFTLRRQRKGSMVLTYVQLGRNEPNDQA